MSVNLKTSLGDLKLQLYCKERPNATLNFLKLCKIKYYNFLTFYYVDRNFIAQTGDPEETGRGGASIFSKIYGEQARYFDIEKKPLMKHKSIGTVSLVNNGNGMLGSQFFITLGEDLDYLDETHCIFGQVVEGLDVLMKINDAICDNEKRPYQDIVIMHTVILDDPYDDPKGLEIPDKSPEHAPLKNRTRIGAFEKIDETEGKTMEEIEESIKDKEAKARATILEMVGDIPDVDVKPPDNVLFVCKLNPVTKSDDLEIIFSQFGKILSCEVIKDQKTGDSLQYAFIEFEKPDDCEKAYFKMNNVLIDDRRIHVDFSQSVSKLKYRRPKESNSQYRIKQTNQDLVFEDEKVGRIVDNVLNPAPKRSGNSQREDLKDKQPPQREDTRTKSPLRRDKERNPSPREPNRYRKRSPSASSDSSEASSPNPNDRSKVRRSPLDKHGRQALSPHPRSPRMRNRSPLRRERDQRNSRSPKTRRQSPRRRNSRSPISRRSPLERERRRGNSRSPISRRTPLSRDEQRRRRESTSPRSSRDRRRDSQRSPPARRSPIERGQRTRGGSSRYFEERRPRDLNMREKDKKPRSPRERSPGPNRNWQDSSRRDNPSTRVRRYRDSSEPSSPPPRRQRSPSPQISKRRNVSPRNKDYRVNRTTSSDSSPRKRPARTDSSESSSSPNNRKRSQELVKKSVAPVVKRKRRDSSSSSSESDSSSSSEDLKAKKKCSKKKSKKKRKRASSTSSSSDSPVDKKSKKKHKKKKSQKKKKKKHTK